MAGLPSSVITRAQDILARLNNSDQSNVLSQLGDELPLFTQRIAPEEKSTLSAIEEKLENIDPDKMTPREAHNMLYELKSALEAK